MKNLLLAFFLFISSQSIAQLNKASLSFGPSFGDPVNTSGTEYFKKGIGAGIRGYLPVSKNGALMANVNYISFGAKEKYTTSYSLTTFKVGYKTFLNNSKFYLYADAGLALISVKDALALTGKSERITPAFGLGFGYSLPVTKNSYLDISPALNFNNAASFGRRLTPEINIGYRINLHK